jgi:CheY-like chemotaxis protein
MNGSRVIAHVPAFHFLADLFDTFAREALDSASFAGWRRTAKKLSLIWPSKFADKTGIGSERFFRLSDDPYFKMPLTDHPFRILLAEDNAINQQVVKLMLKSRGLNVDIAGNGSEALQAHNLNPYDLILMDCQMPEMDGFEATHRIRQLNQSQPLIVALTANALVGERERCLAAGMDDYLSKPFTVVQLEAIMCKAFEKAAVRSSVLLAPA